MKRRRWENNKVKTDYRDKKNGYSDLLIVAIVPFNRRNHVPESQ